MQTSKKVIVNAKKSNLTKEWHLWKLIKECMLFSWDQTKSSITVEELLLIFLDLRREETLTIQWLMKKARINFKATAQERNLKNSSEQLL